jgi:hypothetical protein
LFAGCLLIYHIQNFSRILNLVVGKLAINFFLFVSVVDVVVCSYCFFKLTCQFRLFIACFGCVTRSHEYVFKDVNRTNIYICTVNRD